MSDSERKRLRELQDKWLAAPHVAYQTANYGWEQPITASPGAPTFAAVRDMLLPDWEAWFADFFREEV